MVLEKLQINKDGLYYKIKTTKVGNYSNKDELFYSSFLQEWWFTNEKRKIKEVLYSREEHKNVLFIEFENDEVLKGYYIDGLELI